METKITDALRHIASYQLRQAAIQYLQMHAIQFGAQSANSVELLFNSLLSTPSKQQAQRWIDIIFKLEMKDLRQKYPRKSPRDVQNLS